LSGKDQVTLVFAVGIVGDDYELSLSNIRKDFVNGIKG
jgi:hypothetical protein